MDFFNICTYNNNSNKHSGCQYFVIVLFLLVTKKIKNPYDILSVVVRESYELWTCVNLSVKHL